MVADALVNASDNVGRRIIRAVDGWSLVKFGGRDDDRGWVVVALPLSSRIPDWPFEFRLET